MRANDPSSAASAIAAPASDPAPLRLHDFRRLGPIGPGPQAGTVVGLWLATVLLTHAEYRASGTVFGFPGPAVFVLFAPIVEELVFRGWALAQLVRHTSQRAAILWSSLLFGLYHVRNVFWLETPELLHTMAYTGLVMGPLLAWLTLRCRTLWPAVILHYVNNLGHYV